MVSKGVEKFLGRSRSPRGPAAGQTHQLLQDAVRDVHRADQLPEGDGVREAASSSPVVAETEWSPLESDDRCPACSGSITSGSPFRTWLRRPRGSSDALGGTNPLTFGPFSDPVGDFMHQLVDVDPRAVVEQIRMVRAGNGPGVELFQYTAPDQDHTFRKNSDWGAHHIAFYVRHIDKAVDVPAAQGRAEAVRPLPCHRGPRRRADDQLLRDALRNRHRADQLPARDGIRRRPLKRIPLWDHACDNHP